jgi:hypothetical protein
MTSRDFGAMSMDTPRSFGDESKQSSGEGANNHMYRIPSSMIETVSPMLTLTPSTRNKAIQEITTMVKSIDATWVLTNELCDDSEDASAYVQATVRVKEPTFTPRPVQYGQVPGTIKKSSPFAPQTPFGKWDTGTARASHTARVQSQSSSSWQQKQISTASGRNSGHASEHAAPSLRARSKIAQPIFNSVTEEEDEHKEEQPDGNKKEAEEETAPATATAGDAALVPDEAIEARLMNMLAEQNRAHAAQMEALTQQNQAQLQKMSEELAQNTRNSSLAEDVESMDGPEAWVLEKRLAHILRPTGRWWHRDKKRWENHQELILRNRIYTAIIKQIPKELYSQGIHGDVKSLLMNIMKICL